MAYDTSKLTKLSALQALAQKAEATYAKQTDLTTLENKVSDLVTAGGEPNVLEAVQVNGTALAIDESKAVNITAVTGSADGTIAVNGTDVAVAGYSDLASTVEGKADSATTLEGYGITDAYTKTDADSAIASAVAGANHLKYTIVASADAIDLTAEDADQYIYLVASSNAESGDSYDEYMVINGALEKVGDWYMDLSDYATTESVTTTLESYATTSSVSETLESYATTEAVSTTLADYATTSSVTTTLESYVETADVATDDEVAEMLAEIYGE